MSKYRVMRVHETGEESCEKDNLDVDEAEGLVAELREDYPDARGFYIELMRNYYAEAQKTYDDYDLY